tara:strand:+ start:677 stop:895 length:219 start_codon:yes stop_codon:yes gene_type:complete
MDKIKLALRIIGYSGFGIFFLQIINLYVQLFEPSKSMFQISFIIGILFLFILVLIDKTTNQEDKYYSKNIER